MNYFSIINLHYYRYFLVCLHSISWILYLIVSISIFNMGGPTQRFVVGKIPNHFTFFCSKYYHKYGKPICCMVQYESLLQYMYANVAKKMCCCFSKEPQSGLVFAFLLTHHTTKNHSSNSSQTRGGLVFWYNYQTDKIITRRRCRETSNKCVVR